MSTLSLRLTDSFHEQVKKLAKEDGVSINQFISSAVSEKISALMTQEYLNERAQRASKKAFLKAMKKVPASVPEGQDRLS